MTMSTSKMNELIARIPRECVDRILSYSYNPQPRELMREVRAAAEKRQLIDTWFLHFIEFYGRQNTINIIIFNYINLYVQTHFAPPELATFIGKLTKIYKNNKNRSDAIHHMCSIFSYSQVIDIMDDFNYYIILYHYSINRYNTVNLPSWLQCPCGGFMCVDAKYKSTIEKHSGIRVRAGEHIHH